MAEYDEKRKKREEKEEIDKDVIYAVYQKSSFFKVKQVLNLGKILFSFKSLQGKKDNIDIYMDVDDFVLGIVHGFTRNINGERPFDKKFKDSYAASNESPREIYNSPYGGNATGNNGQPISRCFTISPKGITDRDKGRAYVPMLHFCAKENKATISATGGFTPIKDAAPLKTIHVNCSFYDMEKLLLRWSYLQQDYYSKKYCLRNMQSKFVRESEAEKTGERTQSTQNNQSKPAVNNQTASAPVIKKTINGVKILSPLRKKTDAWMIADVAVNDIRCELWIKNDEVKLFNQEKWTAFKTAADISESGPSKLWSLNVSCNSDSDENDKFKLIGL